MRNLQIKHLTADRLQQAYPLLQSCDPALTLEGWQAFARPLLDGTAGSGSRPAESGIMTVENEQSYITGLFTYRCGQDLRLGRVLTAENFIAFDFLDPAACARALGDALEHLSRQLGCAAVRSIVTLADGPNSPNRKAADLIGRILRDKGHSETAYLMVKAVPRRACLKS